MSVEKVKAYFAGFGMEDRVLEFPVSSATVAEAAAALHCCQDAGVSGLRDADGDRHGRRRAHRQCKV